MMKNALLLVASLLTYGLAVDAQAVDANIVSNNTAIWSVSETHMDSMGNPVTTDLGQPQYVCLNSPLNPPSCPAGATSYGYELPGWTANLSSLPPNAKWIWASKKPDRTPITGTTIGAANAEFSFKAKFFLCGSNPQDGTIWVAADNSVDVFVNGAPTPVLTWNSNSAVGTVTIPAASLKTAPNPNIIELKVKNGPNPSDCGSDQYQCNPAGVVFGGKFSDELSANPTCSNPPGNVSDPPRNLGACPAPQTGSKFSSCICLAGNAAWFDWDTCMSSPPACTGFTYSEWGQCQTDSTHSRTVTGNTPAGCTGTPPTQPVLTGTCQYVPPTCTDFTYSEWGQCQTDNTQSRTVLTSSPEGCTGGTPKETTRTCQYVPPLVGVGDMCARNNGAQLIGTCPAGTTCDQRIYPAVQGPPPWCIFVLWIPSECHRSPKAPHRSVDLFCLRDQ